MHDCSQKGMLRWKEIFHGKLLRIRNVIMWMSNVVLFYFSFYHFRTYFFCCNSCNSWLFKIWLLVVRINDYSWMLIIWNLVIRNFNYSNINYSNFVFEFLIIDYSNFGYSNVNYSNFSYSNVNYSNFSYSNVDHSNFGLTIKYWLFKLCLFECRLFEFWLLKCQLFEI